MLQILNSRFNACLSGWISGIIAVGCLSINITCLYFLITSFLGPFLTLILGTVLGVCLMIEISSLHLMLSVDEGSREVLNLRRNLPHRSMFQKEWKSLRPLSIAFANFFLFQRSTTSKALHLLLEYTITVLVLISI
jgi:hypothetical protein